MLSQRSMLPHMRKMLPIVWSSRCRVNFAALATFVSFSTAILQSKVRGSGPASLTLSIAIKSSDA